MTDLRFERGGTFAHLLPVRRVIMSVNITIKLDKKHLLRAGNILTTVLRVLGNSFIKSSHNSVRPVLLQLQFYEQLKRMLGERPNIL